jgi:hydrogenase maturation protein HypF
VSAAAQSGAAAPCGEAAITSEAARLDATAHFSAAPQSGEAGALIRVRGLVQGVGFRPTVFRLARRHGLRGWVANDGDGVRMQVCGPAAAVEEFVLGLPRESPPLARLDRIEREPAALLPADAGFHIAASIATTIDTGVAADAAACAACIEETFDRRARRYRYPFTNCTHCGPRLAIIEAVPYDRGHTTMDAFPLCDACAAEYRDPTDRRFHAEPVACHVCGPEVRLVRADGAAMTLASWSTQDATDAACTLLQRGHIVAIQGLGGYQLACDATQAPAVARLRRRKRRERKPFAMMGRDLELIRRYAIVSAAEAALLGSTAAPIVVLRRAAVAAEAPTATVPRRAATNAAAQVASAGERSMDAARVAHEVAPGLDLWGFMLPNTPLHHLLLERMEHPIVLTSGNLSDEPQAIEAADARRRLGGIAEYFLEHNRRIARRVDDSVTRVVGGRSRVLRRARGYAPASLPLPPGFEAAPRTLSFGGEQKSTFCMLRRGRAVLSPHLGDLEDALTRADYRQSMADLRRFFAFEPEALACDLHPDYASSQLARGEALHSGLPLFESQHHHAHIAACMAENGVTRAAPAVLGVALDGLGYGEDGTLWGGEFLLADYLGYRRLGSFKPVALLGGEAAIREPWRNTYAHITAQMGWAAFAMNYSELDLYRFLERQPRSVLDGMGRRGVNSPPASSCGRLFDAAAAAMGLARERAAYEGQGAVELEAAVDPACLHDEDARQSYPFAISHLTGLPCIEPLGFWCALFDDLMLRTPVGVMAARFHRGLADSITRMVVQLAADPGAAAPALRAPRVVLSGGVFQNRILFERVVAGLEARGFEVLTHSEVPPNDGGLALGQAAIAAARWLDSHDQLIRAEQSTIRTELPRGGESPCV